MVAALFSPNGDDAPQVEITLRDGTKLAKHRRDFLTGAIVEQSLSNTVDQLAFATADQEIECGLSAGALMTSMNEVIDGLADNLTPRKTVPCTITRADGSKVEIGLTCRIDTEDEIAYYENGGILQYVLRNMAKDAA